MREVETRARLVGLDGDSLAARGPIAVLPRSEIEEAMTAGDGPARLVLEIGRAGGESGGVATEARVSVDWDRAELEELLGATGGDDVALSFDEGELERLLEEGDVEAHGLRERAAVLGIVVATAGAAAGSAFAHPQDIGDGSVGAAPSNAPSFITDSRGGDGGAAAAPAAVTSFITDSRGGTGGVTPAPEAGPSFITDSRGGTGGVAPAPEAGPSFITDSRGGTGGVAPAPDAGTSFVTDSRGGTGGVAPTEAGTTSFITDSRGGTGGVEQASADGGTSISLPSPGDAAGLAGFALLITAAGFIAARSRRGPELPA